MNITILLAHPKSVRSEEPHIPCRHDFGWIGHASTSHDDLGASLGCREEQEAEAQDHGRGFHNLMPVSDGMLHDGSRLGEWNESLLSGLIQVDDQECFFVVGRELTTLAYIARVEQL